MEIYVLHTRNENLPVVSGVYSSKDLLISDLMTKFQGETLDKVEIWDVNKGFVDYLPVKKKTTITIEE